MEHASLVLAIFLMVMAGLAGGTFNAVVRDEPWHKALIGGLGGSFLTPLFLSISSSELLPNVLGIAAKAAKAAGEASPSRDQSILVFAGFCFLAAVSARTFIESLSDRVLAELKQNRQEVREAKQQSEETQTKVEQLEEQSQVVTSAVHDAVEYRLATGKSPRVVESAATAKAVQPGSNADDPWAGQFGGHAEAGQRKLDAEILEIANRPGWCLLRLSVRSTEHSKPLTGTAQFFLHPSFGPGHSPVVPVVDGLASLTVSSWGAFTVGALADNGTTKLELDLASQPGASEPWKSR